jgi:hypothetical protein
MTTDASTSLNESRHKLLHAKANFSFLIESFGDELAKRHNYKSLSGLEAVQVFLINKHHWLPREVRLMSWDDLELALHVEMQDWTPPAEVRALMKE